MSFNPKPFVPNQKGFQSYAWPEKRGMKDAAPESTPRPKGPNPYTAAAIAVRDAETYLWCAVIAAGALSLLPGVQPRDLIPHDRDREWIRGAVERFPTTEVKAAHRAYQRAANDCVRKNMGMVYQVAGRMEKKGARYGLEREDLLQEGMAGLHRALETFDPERGLAFSTYAHWWVYQCINRAICNSGLIRVPVHARAAADAEQAAGAPVSMNGKKPRKGTLDRVRNAERLVSLDAPFAGAPDNADYEFKLLDMLVDPSETPADDVETLERRTSVLLALNSLTPKERSVLEARFWGDKTLEEVGAEMDLTRERIRQIEKLALGKLAKVLERRGHGRADS